MDYAQAFAMDVFIARERSVGNRRRSDTALFLAICYAGWKLEVAICTTPSTTYEKSESLGSGGNMVARLKLKGIGGRARPGVEPAA